MCQEQDFEVIEKHALLPPIMIIINMTTMPSTGYNFLPIRISECNSTRHSLKMLPYSRLMQIKVICKSIFHFRGKEILILKSTRRQKAASKSCIWVSASIVYAICRIARQVTRRADADCVSGVTRPSCKNIVTPVPQKQSSLKQYLFVDFQKDWESGQLILHFM